MQQITTTTTTAGVAEIAQLGGAGLIGCRTFSLYMCTTIVAVAEGMIMVVLFKPLMSAEETSFSNAQNDGALALRMYAMLSRVL